MKNCSKNCSKNSLNISSNISSKNNFDYKEFFNLDNVFRESNFYPKIENYSCYVKLLNCPTKRWILHNIIGTLEKTKKKRSIILRMNDRKLVFKSTRLCISKLKIKGTIEFLKSICTNYTDKLLTPIKCKCKGYNTYNKVEDVVDNNNYDNMDEDDNNSHKSKNYCKNYCKNNCKKKFVLNLNKLDILSGRDSSQCLDFINDMYFLKKNPSDDTILNKYFSDVKSNIIKYNGFKKKKQNKTVLILKFNILKVDGEKFKNKIYEYISNYCKLLNLKRREEIHKINLGNFKKRLKSIKFLTLARITTRKRRRKNDNFVKNDQNDDENDQNDKNLKVTNIIYKIKVPRMFTNKLYLIKNNMKYGILNLDYTVDLCEYNFPALIIKIFNLEDKKTTLSMFQTGYIMLTGFKNILKMKKIYEKLLYFLSLLFSNTRNLDLNKSFSRNKQTNLDYNYTKEHLIIEKLEESWQEEKTTISSVIHSYINYKPPPLSSSSSSQKKKKKKKKNVGENCGLIYRKSDLNDQKELFSKRVKIEHDVDLTKMADGSLNSFYNETLNLFNSQDWEIQCIKNFLTFYKEKIF